MAKWTILKSAIASVIKTNGNQEITGALLQSTLNNIVNTVGENATFAGVATPATNPGVPDGPVFYLATKSGVYSNFNGINLDGTCFVALVYENSSWLKKEIGASINAILDKQNKIPQSKLYNSLYAIDYIIEYEGDLQSVEKEEGIIVILRDGGFIYQCINNEFINIDAANETTLYLLKNPSSLSGYNKFSILCLNEYSSEMDVYASLDDIAKIRKELGTKPVSINETAFRQIELNLNNIELIKTKLKKQYSLTKIEALSKFSPSGAIKDALTAINDNKASWPTIADEIVDYSGVVKILVVKQTINTSGNIYSFSYINIETGILKTYIFSEPIYSDNLSLSEIETKTIAYSSDLDKIKQDYKQADTALGKRIDAEQTAREQADKVLTDNLVKEVTDRTNAVKAEATAREQADEAINTDIQSIKDKGSLFDLFKAAGATLNPDGKTWSMNGITDLTTQELINAYQRRPIGPYLVEVYSNVQPQRKFRTNFPIPSWYNPIIGSADRLCYANSFIEVLQIGGAMNMGGSFVVLNNCSGWLRGAKKLRTILGPNFSVGAIKFGKDDFRECQALADIRLKALQSNIYFQDSPALNKDSIVYMIKEAKPSSPITITLHPTAYAMATADPEIQAELEKQPNISLAEGEPTA